MFTIKSATGTKLPLGLPIPITVGKSNIDKKITQDDDDFGFKTTTVAPHTTVAGYLYYDTQDLERPVLDHAHARAAQSEVRHQQQVPRQLRHRLAPQRQHNAGGQALMHVHANANFSTLNIRPATPADVPTMLGFIRELAAYEREPDAVIATEQDLLRDGFGNTPRFKALIADYDGTPRGFALYFTSYSTWRGHHGIRLEDLYVTPAYRGKGIGKALLAHLARIAVDEGCPRLEWDVLDWNAPAIAVYERIGANILTEWRIMRITGEALKTLASTATSSL